MDAFKKAKLNEIIDTYGPSKQVNQAIEESGELIVSLSKFMRHLANNSDIDKMKECRDAVIDEIADNYVMLEQLKQIFACEKDVELRIAYKINRQIARIKGNEDDL